MLAEERVRVAKRIKRGRGRPRLLQDFPPPRDFSGEEVRALREKLGEWGFKRSLSLTDFAEVLGVDRSAVYAWEHGRQEPSGSARRLMEILDASFMVSRWLLPADGHIRKKLVSEVRKRKTRAR